MNNNVINIGRVTQVTSKDFPGEFLKAMSKWKMIIKSPYGNSFYNVEVGWGYKKHNSLRISDHWNFWANGKLHCKTFGPCPDNTHWTLAKFNGEKQRYEIIHSIRKEGVNNRKTIFYHMLRFNHEYESLYNRREELNWEKAELGLLNRYYKILENFA